MAAKGLAHWGNKTTSSLTRSIFSKYSQQTVPFCRGAVLPRVEMAAIVCSAAPTLQQADVNLAGWNGTAGIRFSFRDPGCTLAHDKRVAASVPSTFLNLPLLLDPLGLSTLAKGARLRQCRNPTATQSGFHKAPATSRNCVDNRPPVSAKHSAAPSGEGGPPDGGQTPAGWGKRSKATWRRLPWACPFYKHDPEFAWMIPRCGAAGFRNIHSVL